MAGSYRAQGKATRKSISVKIRIVISTPPISNLSEQAMNIYTQLEKLNITLPPVAIQLLLMCLLCKPVIWFL
jgi:hypothetical protein